jgi:UPF0716 protein FxsA
MPLLILGLFIAVPIIEIAVFIEVGGRIGLWNTVSIVIVTAMIGTWMLRAQGLRTLESARRSMERQEFPVTELFDGICLLVAGVLLLTPGFVTDAFGFLLFMPPVRAGLRVWIWAILQRREGARVWVDGQGLGGDGHHGRGMGGSTGGGTGGGTIDGDFHVIDPDAPEEDSKPPRLPR